jgi:hypothetical protein
VQGCVGFFAQFVIVVMSGRDDAHSTALTTNLLRTLHYTRSKTCLLPSLALFPLIVLAKTQTFLSLLSWRAGQSTARMTAPKEIQRAEIQVGQVLHLPPPEEVEEVPKLCTA